MSLSEEKRQLVSDQRKENLAKNLSHIDEDAEKVLEDLRQNRLRRQQKRSQVISEIQNFSDIQYAYFQYLILLEILFVQC